MKAFVRQTVLVLMAGLSALLIFQAVLFVKIGLMAVINPPITSFMRAQELALAQPPEPAPAAGPRKTPPKAPPKAAGPVEIRHVWVPYDAISRNIKRAIIAAEDSNFAEHPGIDVEALEKAYDRNKRRGKVVAGGSTITQQLAKNLFLTASRSYVRKGEEFAITFMLEFWLGKERILEIYLNVVEWGVGVFGIEAASEHYYGISAAKLGAGQAAKLAAMLPNPRFYDRNRNAPYLLNRTGIILARMGDAQLP